MDRRRVSSLAACVAALVAAGGCQDYNFNPVGHCLLQPGSRRVTLSDISTADVLFVVDDSGSMKGEQAALAANFSQFLDVLKTANSSRVANGLAPIDFHIAVTTTSSFINYPVTGGATCRNDCQGTAGYVCCLSNRQPQPPQCTVNADCAAGYECQACTNASLVWPVGGGSMGCYKPSCGDTQPIGCSVPDAECGVLEQIYRYDSVCNATPSYTVGLIPNGKYPMGQFLSDSANASLGTAEAKGRVLHFKKEFFTPALDATAVADLSTAFQRNVAVGICGSGQEQGLEAARMAIQRVQGGAQTSGYAAGEFLHAKSKLVVAWISDEDDCSSPSANGSGVVFPPPPLPDGCVTDASLPEAQQREYRLAQYADWFTSLGRPFGAAFIVSSNNACQDTSCTPMICADSACTTGPLTCGGQGVPSRYLSLASQLRSRGADVVVGSICDPFGATLARIGEIVKPPTGLVLPTTPAASEVTILRIADAEGETRKTCSRPAPAAPSSISGAACVEGTAQAWLDANTTGFDWWFTATRDQLTACQRLPAASSQYVYINHLTLNCEANPGETYSLDYLGQVPQGGCNDALECAAALGGSDALWTCEGADLAATPPRKGTCLCR